MTLKEVLQAAFENARTTQRSVPVDLESGCLLSLYAEPDYIILERQESVPSEEEAFEIAQALEWLNPKISRWPLEQGPDGMRIEPGSWAAEREEKTRPEVQQPDTPSLPGWLAALPERYHAMLSAAHLGTLPKGPVKLKSGLVMDLAGYVLAWATEWPLDEAHLTWRLNEVLSVYNEHVCPLPW